MVDINHCSSINHNPRMLQLLIFLTIASCTLAAQLNVIYEWKYIDYLWNSEEQKNMTIAENKYDFTQIFTIDVERVPDGRVFVTTPQFNPQGVPATISTISEEEGPGGPLLRPYPDWSWHNLNDCSGITSVWRVALDDCGRLWVLDSGNIGEDQVCPAQLLVFDLTNDRLMQRIEIPIEVSHNPQNRTLGLLITPVVESAGRNCDRNWVYMADVEGAGLIIFNGTNLWRLDEDIFKADPEASTFNIAGESFVLPDALFGLAISPGRSSKCRRLFFRPLASFKEFSAPIKDLHRSLSMPDVRYTTLNYQFPSQVAAQAFSRDGILFYGLATELAIGCWNMNTPMDNSHVDIVAQDNETLQFASGVKVARCSYNPSKEELWVSTNRFQKIATGTQNFNEINFRILTAPVDTLVEGSNCRL